MSISPPYHLGVAFGISHRLMSRGPALQSFTPPNAVLFSTELQRRLIRSQNTGTPMAFSSLSFALSSVILWMHVLLPHLPTKTRVSLSTPQSEILTQ
jgi:hypothetical protein